MNKEDLLRLAANPDHIPGIYSYCDHWCEHCRFTGRCLAYAQQQNGTIPDGSKMTSEQLWEFVNRSFKLSLELLADIAADEGIDLSTLDSETDAADPSRDNEGAVHHILTRVSRKYVEVAEQWCETNVSDQPASEPHLKLVRSAGEHTVPLGDLVEIVRRYQLQIHVKLARALESQQHEAALALDEFPKDSDGSAKVALIGIDRSIGAWGGLLNHFPGEQTEIMHIIALLKRLRDMAEVRFPNARAFVRPGLDEESGQQ